MSKNIKQNQNKIIVTGLLIISIATWSTAFRLPDQNLRIKVFDVGQGDSIFIRTPQGYKILIDGGPDNKVLDQLGAELPFYDKTLDLLVLTHPDKDHLTGLIEVVKRYEIKNLWTSYSENDTDQYREWQDVLSSTGSERTVVWSGDRLVFSDEVVLEVISPKDQLASDINSSSVVILLDYKDFEGLLTGDAEKLVQPYTQTTSEIEFLKVPHHGAKNALNESFTKALSPEVSVISAGERNRYGHPSGVTLDILGSIGSRIYRTDKNGTVEIVTDGSSWYTNSRYD